MIAAVVTRAPEWVGLLILAVWGSGGVLGTLVASWGLRRAIRDRQAWKDKASPAASVQQRVREIRHLSRIVICADNAILAGLLFVLPASTIQRLVFIAVWIYASLIGSEFIQVGLSWYEERALDKTGHLWAVYHPDETVDA